MQITQPAVRSHSAFVEPTRQQLARIVNSAPFAKSRRHREFLTYLVEHELAQPGVQSKETLVAIVVFRRDPKRFDARLDPIVRIEAGRLRKRLLDYYADAGRDDRVRFEIPRGGYSLRFCFSTRATGSTMVEPTALVGRIDSATRLLDCANDCRDYSLAVD